MTEAGRVTAEKVSDPRLKEAIGLLESNGYYVIRFPNRELRNRLLSVLTDQPQELRTITESVYGKDHDARDQYRVRSCLRRMREAGLVRMEGTVLIGRTYVGMWRKNRE